MTTKASFASPRLYTRPGRVSDTFGDFVCLHCGASVSAEAPWSGVRNRNHCPYCLSSRHLDHFEAGDRLSACRARMRPIGLTLKRTAKKYAGSAHGELMLVHLCEGCGKASINRIAADDDGEQVLALLEVSAGLDAETRARLERDGISLLGEEEADVVEECVWGVAAPTR